MDLRVGDPVAVAFGLDPKMPGVFFALEFEAQEGTVTSTMQRGPVVVAARVSMPGGFCDVSIPPPPSLFIGAKAYPTIRAARIAAARAKVVATRRLLALRRSELRQAERKRESRAPRAATCFVCGEAATKRAVGSDKEARFSCADHFPSAIVACGGGTPIAGAQ